MPKKRKNVQKKSANRPNRNRDQKSAKGSNDSSFSPKKKFEYFPLHLVPNNGYHGEENSRELLGLCKGRVWVIHSFFSHKECRGWIDFCESFATSDENGKGFYEL